MRTKKQNRVKKRKTMKLWNQFGCSLHHKKHKNSSKKCKKCNLFFKGGCGCSSTLVGGRGLRGGCGCSSTLVGGRKKQRGGVSTYNAFVGQPWSVNSTGAQGNSNYYANYGSVIQNDPQLQPGFNRDVPNPKLIGGRRRQKGGFSLLPAPLANMGSSMWTNSVNSIHTLNGTSLNPSPLPYEQPNLLTPLNKVVM